MTTNEKIQYYRKKLGLSQEELGQKLLVSRQTVSLWENGQTAPTIDNLIRLKDIFGVTVDELLGCENETLEEQIVPNESYSLEYTRAELGKIYKCIIKTSFKKPLISLAVFAAVLAVYILIDAFEVLIGIVAGIFVIYAVLILKSFLAHRKAWNKSIDRVAESRYEYRVFEDYFTVDISRNNELVRTEKILFCDVKKAYDFGEEKYIILDINNQLYILRKSDITKNSAFYMALYNSSKQPDKKEVKKLTVAANVFFALSLAIVVLFTSSKTEDFIFENLWIYLAVLPVPVICTALGLTLKKKGCKYKKNIFAGIFAIMLLCVNGMLSYSLSDIDDLVYEPGEFFSEVTHITLPEAVDEYTVNFEEDTQPESCGYIYSTTRIIFDGYTTDNFENTFNFDTRWLDEFPKELGELLSPLGFDEGHKSADKVMLYNIYTNEFNAFPQDSGLYDFLAVFYHTNEKMLEIFEYEYSVSSKEIEDKIKESIMLTDLENAFYTRIKKEIQTWNAPDIYAISFFVCTNEAYSYRGFNNVAEWAISYNTEADCNDAGPFDEERWNYAFWNQNTTYIIDPDNPNKFIDMLFDWYEEQGITNIGEENEDEMYDEDMNYIGKGPAGYYELLEMAANVARKLHAEGVIKEQFGKDIPIIVHELEYYDLICEVTKKANPNGQADVFLKAMEMDFEAADLEYEEYKSRS